MQILRARDVMSVPVRMIDLGDSMWDAWSAMIASGRRHLVVCDRHRCVGVVDDRALFAHWPAGPFGVSSTPIRRLLQPRTTCVLPDAPLSRIAAVMVEESVDAVPVTTADGTVIGVVTASDLVKVLVHHELLSETRPATPSAEQDVTVPDKGGALCAPW